MDLNLDLTKGKILKVILLFAIPICISSILQNLYSGVDAYIIAKYLGEDAFAAIGAASPINDLLIGFALGVTSGTSIIISRAKAKGDEEMLKKSVAISIVIGTIITVLVTIFAIIFMKPLLRLLNTPEHLMQECYKYIFVITSCAIVLFAYNLFSSILRAIGNSTMPLVFLAIASFLNIILDVILVKYVGMGVDGAAVATVLAQLISAILCVIYIVVKVKIIIPTKEHFKLDKKLTKEMAAQGLSMGLMGSVVSLGTLILQYGINSLSTEPLIIAAHTAARKITGICMIPFGALSISMATFVSQNKGAGKYKRIREGVKQANILGIICTVAITIAMYVGARSLISIIASTNNEEIISLGSKYLMISTPFYAVLTFLLNLRNALQGLGAKVVPVISSVIELVGKILFTVIFIPKLGYFGVMICEPVIWCFMTVQLVYSFYTHDDIKKKSRFNMEKVEKVEA